MSAPRIFRCGKCHVTMGLRYYVLAHRQPNDLPCPKVPCVVCEEPVRREGKVAFGHAVCSTVCERNHPGTKAVAKANQEVTDQLTSFQRAEKLPLVYQRRRAS
jgi:hypothetical protein